MVRIEKGKGLRGSKPFYTVLWTRKKGGREQKESFSTVIAAKKFKKAITADIKKGK